MESAKVTISLRGLFFIHLVLVSWVLQSRWYPESYLLYNSVFLACILWTLGHRQSEDAPVMALFANLVGLCMDVITIGMFFPTDGSTSQRFSAGMSIVNLLVRPFTGLLLYRVLQERQGDWGGIGSHFNSLFAPTTRREPYEDIDRNGATTGVLSPTEGP